MFSESVVFPEESEIQVKQLARDSLAKASFPVKESDWLHNLVDRLPGLVRKHVIPAIPLNSEVRDRAPKARIRLKYSEKLPAHVPSQMGPQLTRKLKETTDELCKGGLLEPATSDVATTVMLIPKPSQPDELRLVCDYRDLNTCVEKDLYSIPRISTCLQNFEEKKGVFQTGSEEFLLSDLVGCRLSTLNDYYDSVWSLPMECNAARVDHVACYSATFH